VLQKKASLARAKARFSNGGIELISSFVCFLLECKMGLQFGLFVANFFKAVIFVTDF